MEQHRPRRCDLAKGWCPAKNNTRASPARSLSGRLAALSRGQRGPLLRPDLSSFARQWRVRHKGGGGQIKGHGSGHHDIGAGDRERSRCEQAAYWWFAFGPTAGPPTLALYIGLESAPRHMLYKKTSWLREVSLEYVVCSTGCQYCRYSKRDELGSVDEPSRSAAEGRSSEGLVRTVVKGIRLTVRDNGSSSGIRTLRACSRNLEC
ncbi:hypothetical protein T07_7221 [Trichinella nelsoni]|uniref:Uncharacterized protein n=1 Tax=Trichinella nelsoni TaxID=6336 RepID=A0A0V0S411_9BILA|nr:hypothetical protein T07_7221 [Trichinella nelsoni]